MRGGQSPKARAVLQPGNEVAATWRGRLAEHLGTIGCELVRAHAARILDDPDRLAGSPSAAALVAATLPEREPHAGCLCRVCGRCSRHSIRRRTGRRIMSDGSADLLAALGFGLDLARCAATGATTDLAYVSPRTGRAVSRTAGRPYHDKLLRLPDFLWRDAPADEAQSRSACA